MSTSTLRLIVSNGNDSEELGDLQGTWIVNPIDESVTVLRLEAEEYVEHGLFGRGESATSVLLAGFSGSVGDLFDAR